MTECYKNEPSQLFELTRTNLVKHENICLDLKGAHGVVRFKKCDKNKKSQQWEYDATVGILVLLSASQ